MGIKSLSNSSGIVNFQKHQSMLAGIELNKFHHLETVRLGSSAASVEFTNLGQYSDFQHLQIRMTARSTRSADNSNYYVKFNGDTGSNYAQHYMRGNGSAMESANLQTSGTQGVYVYQGLTSATSGTGTYAASVIDILDPFSTDKYTTIKVFTGFTGAISRVLLESGLWMSTNAVDSITFTEYYGGSFVSGSRFSLYGLKARA